MDGFMVFWLLLGALIGYAAASKRGWSPVAGIIGGALLGILSPLLFLVSGVASDDRTRVCPQCAERIKEQAKVCRYCGAELPALSKAVAPSRSLARRAGLFFAGKGKRAEFLVHCADKETGIDSVERIHAADESAATEIACARGKVVSRVVKVK